jgi:hypothetical protein
MNAQWSVSGLARDGGVLDRLLEGGGGYPPAYVRVENDLLYYGYTDDQGHPAPAPIRHRRGLLAEFVKLADAPATAIAAYARRWGVLDICSEHRRPGAYWHHGKDGKACRPMGWGGELHEPIVRWQDCSRFIRTLLDVVAAVHMGELGRCEDWEVLCANDFAFAGNPPLWHDFDLKSACVRLSWIIQQWLSGDVKVIPFLDWTEPRHPTVRLGGRGLPTALALELLFIMARTDGLAICAACGTPYVPRRKPRAGQRTYCPDCGHRAAERDAARRYRAREKQRTKMRRAKV